VHVFATAGHVDHGKSTLVRALTGSDPDRLEEERRRGLTIQLGYCWTSLPGVGDVAFVDVPGHERFISTTLAGVGPVSAAMLVVAADDPWMPQAAEHLAALDALGVSHGVLVVTRSDLADPAPSLARARDQLSSTSLRGVPAVAVSGRTGAGLDRLRQLLAEVARGLPAPDDGSDVRLWVDRRFHVRGAGTVVTGTLPAGTITVGDSLQPDGEPDAPLVRVRGIECLTEPVASVRGVARVALDLGSKVPDAVRSGSALVTPGAFWSSAVLDVRLTAAGKLPQRATLHVGSCSVAVHVRPLDDRHARLTLQRPLPLRIGDRAILRDPGSRALWGVRVLDPAPPPLRRRGAAAARGQELAPAHGRLADEVARRDIVRLSVLRRIGVRDEDLPEGGLLLGDWVLSPGHVARLRGTLANLVRSRSNGLLPGISVNEAVQALALPDKDLLGGLLGDSLRLEQGRVVPVAGTSIPPALAAAVRALSRDLASAPFTAPDAGRLAELGLDARGLAALARAGHLLRLDPAVVLLPGADAAALEVLRRLPQPFSASQARQALGTSRRVVLPLLAHLDRAGWTSRGPDDRRTVVS
jgi:selenocysteine-specific elongation factor